MKPDLGEACEVSEAWHETKELPKMTDENQVRDDIQNPTMMDYLLGSISIEYLAKDEATYKETVHWFSYY